MKRTFRRWIAAIIDAGSGKWVGSKRSEPKQSLLNAPCSRGCRASPSRSGCCGCDFLDVVEELGGPCHFVAPLHQRLTRSDGHCGSPVSRVPRCHCSARVILLKTSSFASWDWRQMPTAGTVGPMEHCVVLGVADETGVRRCIGKLIRPTVIPLTRGAGLALLMRSCVGAEFSARVFETFKWAHCSAMLN